jgi:hypothetical protein
MISRKYPLSAFLLLLLTTTFALAKETRGVTLHISVARDSVPLNADLKLRCIVSWPDSLGDLEVLSDSIWVLDNLVIRATGSGVHKNKSARQLLRSKNLIFLLRANQIGPAAIRRIQIPYKLNNDNARRLLRHDDIEITITAPVADPEMRRQGWLIVFVFFAVIFTVLIIFQNKRKKLRKSPDEMALERISEIRKKLHWVNDLPDNEEKIFAYNKLFWELWSKVFHIDKSLAAEPVAADIIAKIGLTEKESERFNRFFVNIDFDKPEKLTDSRQWQEIIGTLIDKRQKQLN